LSKPSKGNAQSFSVQGSSVPPQADQKRLEEKLWYLGIQLFRDLGIEVFRN
jgi:hypothetical protein